MSTATSKLDALVDSYGSTSTLLASLKRIMEGPFFQIARVDEETGEAFDKNGVYLLTLTPEGIKQVQTRLSQQTTIRTEVQKNKSLRNFFSNYTASHEISPPVIQGLQADYKNLELRIASQMLTNTNHDSMMFEAPIIDNEGAFLEMLKIDRPDTLRYTCLKERKHP